MLFPVIHTEQTLQTNDMTRLDASRSYCTPDTEILSVLIQPDANSSAVFDVTTTKYLDWQYSASGDYSVICKVASVSGGPYTEASGVISVITPAQDYLFSDDQRLKQHEPDIIKWVQVGRNSFNDVHRRCQEMILDYIDQKGYTDSEGNKYTKEDIMYLEEVRSWATFMALRVIFEGMSNAVDDVFAQKAKRYFELERQSRDRAAMHLDSNGDGSASTSETTYTTGGIVVRR